MFIVPSGSPDILEALDVSPTEILVMWTEVEAIDRNGIIIVYEVDFQPATTFNDSSMIDVRNTTNTSILLQELHEFVEYNITVRAFTSQGPGPFSEHVLSTTQESSELAVYYIIENKVYIRKLLLAMILLIIVLCNCSRINCLGSVTYAMNVMD